MQQSETPDLVAIPSDEDDLDVIVSTEIQRTVPEGFHVRDHDSAAWVVRRIVQAREYGERVKMWAETERRRAEAEEKRLHFLFGHQLRAWAEAEMEKLKRRRKSIALPGGTIGFRTSKASVVIDDADAVLAWAKRTCPSLVVLTERISRSGLNEHVSTTGEVPEVGVHIEPEREVFFVR